MKTMKYFSATWCGHCKSFKPVMTELASAGHAVQFIDVDESPDLAQQYNVRSVPTVVIEENGSEVNRVMGAVPKQQILESMS